jgi:hypothetical protein
VAQDRIDHSAEIPEADLLEQQAPLDALVEAETVSGLPDRATDTADEADRLEQREPVPDRDDDYPYGPSGAGWS